MVKLLLQYHKHEKVLNILAFVHPLSAKKAMGKVKKVLGPGFEKIPCLSPHEKI
jgi:hypothetical protein